MWMDVRIYSQVRNVYKVNSQIRNVWVYVMTTQKDKSHKILSLGSQKFLHFAEKLAGDLKSRRERYWGYVSTFEIIPEKLILKSIFPLKVAATLISGSWKGAVGA